MNEKSFKIPAVILLLLLGSNADLFKSLSILFINSNGKKVDG